MRVSRSVVVCGIVAGWLAIATAQDAALVPSYPALLSDIGLPGIDRGLRDNDPPRDPRTEGVQVIEGEPYVRGSIIVKFRAGTGFAAQRAMLAQVSGSATRSLSYADFDLVAIDPAADPEAVARQLDAQPDIEYAQARYVVGALFVPNDPLYSRQWNYQIGRAHV